MLPPNTGGVTAFKFRDLGGHPLELIRFPAGVGDPRWQRPSPDGPTLGIDHFALVVRSVDPGTAWLSQRLDFRVDSRSVNRSAEQDRLDGLDGLDGVEVEVVALAPRAAVQRRGRLREVDAERGDGHGGYRVAMLDDRCIGSVERAPVDNGSGS